MHLPRYSLSSSKESLEFEFASLGPKGLILKKIQFERLGNSNIFNIAFGDLDGEKIDDFSISNNQDSEKIMNTVAVAIHSFSNRYPYAWIYATGSTAARNRLYRRGLSKHIQLLKKQFEIYGETSGQWEVFQSHQSYDAFLAKRRFT